MIASDEPAAKMKHFAAAFFGCHLQGKAEYADYFSEEFVSKREDPVWGVFEEE